MAGDVELALCEEAEVRFVARSLGHKFLARRPFLESTLTSLSDFTPLLTQVYKDPKDFDLALLETKKEMGSAK